MNILNGCITKTGICKDTCGDLCANYDCNCICHEIESIDNINKDLNDLAYDWMLGNAYGIPITSSGHLTLDYSLDKVQFKEKINIQHHLYKCVLKEVRKIFKKYGISNDRVTELLQN